MMNLLAVDYSNNQWINFLVVGLIAGSLIAAFRSGKGFGILGNLVVGVVGAILGAALYEFVLSKFISLEKLGSFTLRIDQVVLAMIGALLFLMIISFLSRRRR